MHGQRVIDDVRLLTGLESLELEAAPTLADGDVIHLCKQNPALKKFIFDSRSDGTFTKLAYINGLTSLHRLEYFKPHRDSRILDDCTFGAIVRTNASTLREIDLSEQPQISLSLMCSIAFECYKLEKLVISTWGGALFFSSGKGRYAS